jgi:hypothetical protein
MEAIPSVTAADLGLTEEQSWTLHSDAVQSALAYIKSRGKTGITAEELVTWDAAHGKRLFTWAQEDAAQQWRIQQARVFLNSFRGVIDRMRVRMFRRVPAGEETGLAAAAYLDTQTISEDMLLRTWAISDLTKRIKKLGSELKFWKLTESERQKVLVELEAVLSSE